MYRIILSEKKQMILLSAKKSCCAEISIFTDCQLLVRRAPFSQIIFNSNGVEGVKVISYNLWWQQPHNRKKQIKNSCKCLHFGNEGSQSTDDFSKRPRILLPIDTQVIRQPCSNMFLILLNINKNRNYTIIYQRGGQSNRKQRERRDNSWWPCAWMDSGWWRRRLSHCLPLPTQKWEYRRSWLGWPHPLINASDHNDWIDKSQRSNLRWRSSKTTTPLLMITMTSHHLP